MKKLFLITLLLLSSSLAFARFEMLGKYESEQGGRFEFNIENFSKHPVCLYVMFGLDTKFDYLRTLDICFKVTDYKAIFESTGSFNFENDEVTIISGKTQILPTGKKIISLDIKKRLNPKTDSLGSIHNLQMIFTNNILEKAMISSSKRINGLLFSYGMKKAYETSESFTKYYSPIDQGEMSEEEISKKLGL